MLRATAVLGNSQRLDGGAMFGNAPRALWQTWLPPDDQGRVPLVCRALLIEDADRKVLLETGIGAFFEPKYKDRYGVVEAEHVLLESLRRVGVDHSEIDVVVVSHLHFDHAGGLLAPFREGESASLLFPKARFVVGRTAFERATHPHQRDRASFIAELPDLLVRSGRLTLLDEEASTAELLGPRFRFWRTQGHTPGMLHTEVIGNVSRVFFCADLVPGLPWLHLPITMGYDRYPERLIDEKQELYARAIEQHTGLFFTHDPKVALAFIGRDDKGRFVAEHTSDQLRAWDLDEEVLPSAANQC